MSLCAPAFLQFDDAHGQHQDADPHHTLESPASRTGRVLPVGSGK
jgi:hypothetical protein